MTPAPDRDRAGRAAAEAPGASGPGAGAPGPAAPARPRLLVVGPLPPPIGGVETFTQALLESRALERFEVAHCDITKGRPKSTQGRFDLGNLVWALRHFWRMVRWVVRFRPHVAYVPIAGTWSGVLRDLALVRIAKRSGARVVAHQHAGDIHDVLARRGRDERLVRAGLARCDRILVLGERWRRLLVEYGVAAPVEVCPSTFRREVFARGAAHRPAPRAGGTLGVLFVGQVGRRKGVLDLLEALRAVLDRGTEVTLTITGPAQLEGELGAALEARARLGLESRVELTGPLTGEALYDRFRAADLFALPSHNEGIPAVLYEAGAFGLPVLTTPVGAIPDLVRDGVTGVLVPPGDVAALAAALERLAGDAALRGRLGAALREEVARFHPDRVAERVARAVLDTLEER